MNIYADESDILTSSEAEDILKRCYNHHTCWCDISSKWQVVFKNTTNNITTVVSEGKLKCEIIHIVYTELYYNMLKETLIS